MKKLLLTAVTLLSLESAFAQEFKAPVNQPSKETNIYVTLKHDMRKCMSPICGGYWLKKLNSSAAEQYVSGLDLQEQSIDGHELNQLILRGHYTQPEPQFGTRAFVVEAVYTLQK